jgi:hypothetical protein
MELAKNDPVLNALLTAFRNEVCPDARAERARLYHLRLEELRQKSMEIV